MSTASAYGNLNPDKIEIVEALNAYGLLRLKPLLTPDGPSPDIIRIFSAQWPHEQYMERFAGKVNRA